MSIEGDFHIELAMSIHPQTSITINRSINIILIGCYGQSDSWIDLAILSKCKLFIKKKRILLYDLGL